MKLYVNSKGQWAGTQADAKKIGATVTEVPTDKTSLLAFLNGQQQAAAPEPTTTSSPSKMTQTKSQTLFDVAKDANLQELQHVVYRYLMKIDDALDLKKGMK